MGQTPDRFPGEADEEGIVFEDNSAGDPTALGGMRYVSGHFRMKDSIGVFNPRDGLPVPNTTGDILYSRDGLNFTVELPLVSNFGIILTNEDAEIVVKG